MSDDDLEKMSDIETLISRSLRNIRIDFGRKKQSRR